MQKLLPSITNDILISNKTLHDILLQRIYCNHISFLFALFEFISLFAGKEIWKMDNVCNLGFKIVLIGKAIK